MDFNLGSLHFLNIFVCRLHKCMDSMMNAFGSKFLQQLVSPITSFSNSLLVDDMDGSEIVEFI